jgi:hypothetical protein
MTKDERELRRLQTKVWEEHQKKQTQKAQKLVGKYFKFRNSYSCPEGEKDKWWLYTAIIGVKDGCCVAIDFQTDKNGDVSIAKAYHAPQFFENLEGYVPITKEEYVDEFAATIGHSSELYYEVIHKKG